MKNGWETKRLGEVCSFLNRGISPKYLTEGGICVLNQKCIRDHRVSYEPSRRHDAQAKMVGRDRLVQAGDVLVNSTGTGTLGRVAQLRENPPEPTTVDSHVTIVRPTPGKFYPEFFGYILVVIEDSIKDAGEGCGGQTELARSVLAEKFSVHYPGSIPEQKRIVDILDEAFEGIATAKANAEKNLHNAHALFESHLQSVFAQRGEGWVEKSLGEICEVKDGTHDSPKYVSDGIPFVTQKNIRKEGLSFEKTRFISQEDHDDFYRRSNATCGDILISMIGANRGMACIVDDKRTFSIKNVGLVKQNPLVNQQFLLHFLKSPQAASYVQASSKGGAQEFVGLTELRRFPIPLPPQECQDMLADTFQSLRAETQRLESIYQQKLVALEALKKSLLHQAFTGEL